MRLRPIAAFAPLALLAACGGNPQGQGPVVSAEPGTLPPVTAEDAPEQTALVSPLVAEPAALKGMSPIEIKAVLGAPVFTRRDAPAEIWQYRGHACTLDLFIYDGSTGQTVAHYAIRSVNAIGEKECFEELRAVRRSAPSS